MHLNSSLNKQNFYFSYFSICVGQFDIEQFNMKNSSIIIYSATYYYTYNYVYYNIIVVNSHHISIFQRVLNNIYISFLIVVFISPISQHFLVNSPSLLKVITFYKYMQNSQQLYSLVELFHSFPMVYWSLH